MRVSVISATENPVETISRAAGTCYGKFDASQKRVETCFKAGHLSVFEHASVTFRVEGISRACMAQLTRHRLVSFCVESQRYCRYDLSGDDWYVTPPEIGRMNAIWYDARMADAAAAYRDALAEGVKPEDARYLLPEATKTNLVMTCNVRELFHLLDMRMARSAQWEVQGLARALHAEAAGVSEQWAWLMDLYA